MTNSRPGFAERFAHQVTTWCGSTTAFLLSVSAVVIWLITGPIFDYSDAWQLVINTATTIITFLMVFLIQRTQNKDSLVIQSKLNEIIAALEGASNNMINIEDLSEAQLKKLHESYRKFALMEETGERSTATPPADRK